jgi:hypothetical protein
VVANNSVTNTKGNSYVVVVILDSNWLGISVLVIVKNLELFQFFCLAIDPCTLTRCQHYCSSQNGRARCECRPGYTLSYDQKSCIAKDMCELNNGDCEQECIQTGNEYRCGCRNGFELADDQKSCQGKLLKRLLRLTFQLVI